MILATTVPGTNYIISVTRTGMTRRQSVRSNKRVVTALFLSVFCRVFVVSSDLPSFFIRFCRVFVVSINLRVVLSSLLILTSFKTSSFVVARSWCFPANIDHSQTLIIAVDNLMGYVLFILISY